MQETNNYFLMIVWKYCEMENNSTSQMAINYDLAYSKWVSPVSVLDFIQSDDLSLHPRQIVLYPEIDDANLKCTSWTFQG